MAKDTSKNKSLAKAKKRARTAAGKFKADNPKTPNVNEAYESPSFLKKNWKGFVGAAFIIVVGFIIGSYNK